MAVENSTTAIGLYGYNESGFNAEVSDIGSNCVAAYYLFSPIENVASAL